MGTDASWPLQQAITARLGDSDKLREFLGSPPRLFDLPRPDAETPNLVFGDSTCRAWRSATFDGQEHEIALHLWSPRSGSGRTREIASLIIGLLHDADLDLPGHALVDLQFESSETRLAADNATFHCRIEFRGLTVSD